MPHRKEKTIQAHRPASVIAFFDTDETLLGLEAGQLEALAALGIDPHDLLRTHYRLYAGTPWAELMEQGRLWYDEFHRGHRTGPPFVTPALTALRAHQEAGHLTALVSDSFAPRLTPLRRDLGADLVLCTEPVLDSDRRLTGEIHRPMAARACWPASETPPPYGGSGKRRGRGRRLPGAP
ncbi:HAD family hydrolase [Streptomyces sp. CA-249302]|uniref:HAD family hydrolase n=1 Tax=Streptomyces sp. CA-249302 TaxID=3240058 RepID=UPI003D8AC868